MNFESPRIEKKEEYFFSRKLDKEEVLEKLHIAYEKLDSSSEEVMILKEKISDKLSFEAGTHGYTTSFYLKNENDDKLIDFQYRRVVSCFSQVHREIKRKELKGLDVNPSMFLSKVEEFLTIMANDNRNVSKFLINTGQENVIKWALRNGYKFMDRSQVEKYRSIIEGKDDNYVITDEFKDGDKYDKYIMSKDKMAEAKDHLEKSLKEGEKRDCIDLRHFSQRFDMVKNIKKEDN